MGGGRRVVVLGTGRLGLADLDAVAGARATVALADQAWPRIASARAVVDDLVARAVPAYGITTGVGSQKDHAVPAATLEAFNRALITAHASRSPGDPAPAEAVRAALAIQIHLFAMGRSGVRPALVEALLDRLVRDALPAAGLGASIGASDIVALSQMALPLIRAEGGSAPPLDRLAAKEALSLMNSNALTLGHGVLVLAEARRLLAAAEAAAALALEGFLGNPTAWILPAGMRRRHGQDETTDRLAGLLGGSRLWTPGRPRLLQDPLSLRCVPQINGAARAALDWAESVWEDEINLPVDNPSIEADGACRSHGNMETTLPALAQDALRLAIAKAVEASGERLAKLHWPSFSGLPMGLARTADAAGGVQFLNLGHIAAAAVTACKTAAQPVLPHYRGQVCDGVEDVAGAAPEAVAATARALAPAWRAIAAEAYVAAWAVERRGIAADELGAGTRALYRVLEPYLIPGREGIEPFDLSPVVTALAGHAATLEESMQPRS